MKVSEDNVHWRANGPYQPVNASKAGLLDETRQFLLTYARLGSLSAVRQSLIADGLPQRSRATRETIVEIIQRRLVRWQPPAWVWDDLVRFAHDDDRSSLQASLLLHVTRQDSLLYDVVQEVIVPRWYGAEHTVTRADVQRFLDAAQGDHPEIDGWSHATREKLAGNLLTILRDYGLLRGTARKQIVEPAASPAVVEHLVRLLQAEGIPSAAMADHPDWQLWLWDADRARAVTTTLMVQERTA